TTGAIARGEALAAGDPDWMNVTRWPRDATTVEHPCGDYPAPCNCDDPETHDGAVSIETTTEDVLDSLPYFTFEDDDVAPDEEFVRKADVARLLSTARTRPGREQIIEAIGHDSEWCRPERGPGRCCDAPKIADAVLALLAD